jgi:cytochrome c-type biogenesis protein
MLPLLDMQAPSIFAAFFAGLVSFLSPCVLPLVPPYLAYISGRTAQTVDPLLEGSGPLTATDLDRQVNSVTSIATRTTVPISASGGAVAVVAAIKPGRAFSPRLNTFIHALFFVLGFGIIFTLLGLSAGALGGILYEHRETVRQIAGIILIIFGIHTLGLINIPFLNFEKRMNVNANPRLGYLSSSLVGMGFAVGWVPCVGVTLGAVYTLAFDSANVGSAALLFFVFTLGLGVPFLIASLAIGSVSGFLRKLTSHSLTWRVGGWTIIRDLNIVSFISGVFLLLMGWAIFQGSLGFFSQFLPSWNFNV